MKKQVTKSSKVGKIVLAQEETVAAPSVQSGVRAGASFAPVSFAPVSFLQHSFAPASFSSKG